MKIALDVSPITEESMVAHKVRGVGFYLEGLKKAFETYFPNNNYLFFSQGKPLPKNIDVIHYPYFEPFSLTLPLKKSAKTAVTVHDLTPLVFPEHFPTGIKGKLRWYMQRLALQCVDVVITDSQSSKRDIVRLTKVSPKKIHVVPLAAGEAFKVINMSIKDKEELLKKYHLPKKFALYVGDITRNKNLPRLVRAIQRTEIPLVMVGKAIVEREYDASNPWNHDRVEVQGLINASSQFFPLGFVPTEDLVKIYNLATVFIMPSLYEGFGLPILEAMSCGCPVITTREGSLPEVAGDAVYYVDAYSKEHMSKGIQEVFDNTSLQKELSQKGLEQVKKFSWKNTAQQTLAAYEAKS